MSFDHVLTLVHGGDALAAEAVVRSADALRRLGAEVGAADWLAAAVACDLPFDGVAARDAEDAARHALDDAPIDLAAQPAADRRKRLLIADMESTVIANEMLDELADFLGQRPRMAAITARAMNGELDFQRSLRARVALLAGQPVSLLERARARIRLNPGAATLIATLRAHGVTTALVSGGFEVFTAAIAARLGFDHFAANGLEVVDGTLTGRVRAPILDRDAKRQALRRHRDALGLVDAQVAAVGDGANDLAMLTAAGLGIAYHAKPAVAAAARFRIEHADLRAVLFFQGYRGEALG